MSAAQGSAALDVAAAPVPGAPGQAAGGVQDHGDLPPRPFVAPVPSLEVAARSAAADWAAVLRLRSLPVVLLGPVVALLLALSEPSFAAGPAAAVVAGVLVVHVLAALVQALADPRRSRAGRLRRVEAGRALLGAGAAGAALVGGIALARGAAALLLAAAGAAAVVLRARPVGPAGRLSVLRGAVCAVVACAGVWWGATGTLPWQVLLAAVPVGALVHGLRSATSTRALLAAPCAAVGAAVAVHALPWPALLVALSLPSARRAAVAGHPAAVPARAAALLLVLGLVGALLTDTGLPLSAAP